MRGRVVWILNRRNILSYLDLIAIHRGGGQQRWEAEDEKAIKDEREIVGELRESSGDLGRKEGLGFFFTFWEKWDIIWKN